MTSRDLPRSKTSNAKLYNGIELFERTTDTVGSDDDVRSAICVNTEPSCQFHHHVEDDNLGDEGHPRKIGIFLAITSFMPRVPLLGRLSAGSTTSYGALPKGADSSFDDEYESGTGDDGDAYTEGDKPKRSSGAIRRDSSTSSSGTRRHKDENSSQLRTRRPRGGLRSSNSTVNGENGLSASKGGQIEAGLPLSASEGEDGDHDESISTEDDDLLNPPDNSPYPQVRASVAATDDTSASINTPRMWILSIFFALLGSATNLFFSLRYPSVSITPVIALVIVHPLGRAWDRLLKREDDPFETFEDGVLVKRSKSRGPISRRTKFRLWLGKGQWNGKEHACVYVSSNVSFGFAFATDVIVEQAKFYHQDLSIVYQLLLTISTQILGYSFAGLTRRFLVRPPSMIWPGTLMSTAMFATMHSSENKSANGWIISRWDFFVYVWAGAFAWYFLPGLLFPALSYFSVITWFAPKNVVVANLFGVSSGLGLFPVTFDWAQIAYIGSPLLTPFWAAANVVGGLVIIMWIIAPIMYYRNALFAAFMPIISSVVFDDTAKPYDVSRILTSDYHFDHEAYSNYSKVYLPITYALSYGVQFAGLAALVTHTACWYGRDIWHQSQRSFIHDRGEGKSRYEPVDQGIRNGSVDSNKSDGFNTSSAEPDVNASLAGEDVHSRLMRRYEDAPMTWYLGTFVVMLAIGIFVVEYYPVYLPWYGLILALSITALLFIPVGIVMAITNQHSSLYLICQIICGVVFPGRPVANMVFVTYCYISSAQGVKFSSDLKLGHYMKIPSKLLFKIQLTATFISSITQIGVLNWMFAYIPSICTPDAINGFTCPLARVHFNGSILWGVVGPQRFFGEGALYRPLIWGFLVGFVAPIGVWLIGRKKPGSSVWRNINLPVLFGSLSWIPPATGLNFSVWALICFIFNSYLRRRAPAWWGKYTMTLSAALDSGLAFGVVVVFFGFLYPGWSWLGRLDWWGSRVYKEGCDWQACPYKTLKPGEHFGS